MELRTMRYFLAAADKITTEFLSLDDVLGGEVYFGLTESYQIRFDILATKDKFSINYEKTA